MAGSTIGSLIGGVVGEKLGRKRGTIALSVLSCLGCIMTSISSSFPVILTGRFFVGVFATATRVVASTFTNEILQPLMRPAMQNCDVILMNCGILINTVLGAFLSWRIVNLVNLVPFSILVVGVAVICYESPTWLVNQNRIGEAQISLIKIRGNKARALFEVAAMVQAKNNRGINEDNGTFLNRMKSAVTDQGFLKPLGILLVLFILFLDYSGCVIVNVYTITILEELKLPMNPYWAMAAGVGLRIIVILSASRLTNKMQRKPLLFITGIIYTFSLMVLSVYFFCKASMDLQDSPAKWIPLPALMVIFTSFHVGVLPYMINLPPIMLPNHRRTLEVGIVRSFHNLMQFTFTIVYPIVVSYLGLEYAFLGCAISMTLGLTFALFMLPETYGKTLEHIEGTFANNCGCVQIATETTKL